jgi:hypothetical protein
MGEMGKKSQTFFIDKTKGLPEVGWDEKEGFHIKGNAWVKLFKGFHCVWWEYSGS